ncbi:hypothetical protein V1477_001414 [Vespula maculifrons]|uniref:Uncharacterized protein n=1 Tax=Vespula maculifrons TaxID=7453 RepID=A0ABD2D0F1_VESMC
MKLGTRVRGNGKDLPFSKHLTLSGFSWRKYNGIIVLHSPIGSNFLEQFTRSYGRIISAVVYRSAKDKLNHTAK